MLFLFVLFPLLPIVRFVFVFGSFPFICLFGCLFFHNVFGSQLLLSLVVVFFCFFARYFTIFFCASSLFCLGVCAYLFACGFVCMLVSPFVCLFTGLFFLVVIVFYKGSTSLPGGNQVDGLPPASSLEEKTGEETYFMKNL